MHFKTAVFLGCAFSLLLPVAASADSPNYDFLEVGFLHVNTDIAHLSNGQGYGTDGSYLISNNVFIVAGYSRTDFDTALGSVHSNGYQAGFGLRFPLSNNVDLRGNLEYAHSSSAAPTTSTSQNGYDISLGLRDMETEVVELDAGVGHSSLSNSSANYGNARIGFNLTPAFAIGISYQHKSHIEDWGIDLRWYY